MEKEIEAPKKTLEWVELETKYSVEGDLVYKFKDLVQSLPGLEQFVYIESDDIYYVNETGFFLRYRFSKDDQNKRAEVTWKTKPEGAKNNIRRTEVNWRVDGTSLETIEAGAELNGFKRNFKISKLVHIYVFSDATIPFYTVTDEAGKKAHFIEIEVKEELLSQLTEEQGWDIIRAWETRLAPLGITPQKRLRKSLFEMYKKDLK